jgi:hypothetical protein
VTSLAARDRTYRIYRIYELMQSRACLGLVGRDDPNVFSFHPCIRSCLQCCSTIFASSLFFLLLRPSSLSCRPDVLMIRRGPATGRRCPNTPCSIFSMEYCLWHNMYTVVASSTCTPKCKCAATIPNEQGYNNND